MINFEQRIGTMVKKYYIKDIKQDWLLKPGMVVYIEREYDELINNYIEKHLTHLQEICKKQGVLFLYIPRFYSSLPYSMLKYYIGKELSYSTKIHTYDILSSILSNIELSQVQEPSFLFTGSADNECIAYAIGQDTSLLGKVFASKKEKYIERSINQILSNVSLVYGDVLPQIEQDLTYEDYDDEEPVTRFRVSDSGTRFRVSGSGTKSEISDEMLEKILDELEFDDDEDFNSNACEQAQKFVARLLHKGFTKETIWALLAPMKELSPIKITRDFRILLTSYNMEIELPPVQKAVYLLFLKHPNGINFKDMLDYQDELFHIYRKIAIRGVRQKHVETITDLVNPLSNSMNEKCSIIKKRVTALLDDELARHYYISGGKGEIKKINISPTMIVWE